MRIVIYGNEYQESHLDDLHKLFTALNRYNSWVEIERDFYDYLCSVMPTPPVVNDVINPGDDFSAAIAISVGGDGTFLRTAQWVSAKGIPILGINTGTLGYLAEVSVNDIDKVVENLFNKDYKIEERTVLEISTSAPVNIRHPFALNELAISKEDTASMIKMEAMVNDTYLTTFKGDGVLISTPTGSTAYNLSIGGPVLEPTSRNWIFSPIAPHSLTMRPLVLKDDCSITITTSSRSGTYRVALDGRSYVLPAESSVTVHKAPFCVKLIQQAHHHFTTTLRNKLMWGMENR